MLMTATTTIERVCVFTEAAWSSLLYYIIMCIIVFDYALYIIIYNNNYS